MSDKTVRSWEFGVSSVAALLFVLALFGAAWAGNNPYPKTGSETDRELLGKHEKAIKYLYDNAPTLVWDSLVSGESVTSLQSPALDASAHGGYEFEIWIYNPTGVTAYYSLYFNNDETAANYNTGHLYQINGGAATTSHNTDAVLAGLITLDTVVITGTVNFSPSLFASCLFSQGRKLQKYTGTGTIIKNATVANLTRIDIVGSVAGSIGANSRIRLWRRK